MSGRRRSKVLYEARIFRKRDIIQKYSQYVTHFSDLLVTIIGILCKSTTHYLLQLRRNWRGPDLIELTGFLVDDLVTDIDSSFSIKWPRAGQHFVQQNARRENVCSFI